MPIDVTMPRLSDTMEAGTVVRWHVKEGDAVLSGAVVADIETDKATMEMQVFDDGKIARILVPAGQSVSVGTKIAEISGDEESATPGPGAASTKRAGGAPSASTPAPAAIPPAPLSGTASPQANAASSAGAPARSSVNAEGAMRVSPVARRMAEDMGVDLAQVRGSGPAGRIIKRDIEAAAETHGARVPLPGARSGGPGSDMARSDRPTAPLASPIVPASVRTPAAASSSTGGGSANLVRSGMQSVEMPLSSMRQTIARRLVESTQSIPHYQVSMTFDMDALVALRGALNTELETLGVKLSVNDFVVRACALAMARHPYLNASWGGDRIFVHQTVNVGVAVALDEEKGGGLLVATVRDADRKSLRQISLETKALSEKARTKGLSMEEMSESTFTISNLGMFGVENFTAIINPPNSAILACGAAVQKPVVRNGALAVGWEMTATLSLDHRVIDGAMAARYLKSLRHLFEHPTLLLV